MPRTTASEIKDIHNDNNNNETTTNYKNNKATKCRQVTIDTRNPKHDA